ncbi:MAG: hypothetical protein BRD57_04175, partial [Proteobacteria bacterium SW_6_67_9]
PPRLRAELAQVAARLMAEEGMPGFAEAKAKALDRLGVAGRPTLPSNQEVEAEVKRYQALFQADEQAHWLWAKRRAAVEVMRLLEPFTPLLVGSVLRGTAPAEAEVSLHVFADPPERVATFLYDRGVAWNLDSWIGRFGGGRELELPVYRIRAGEEQVRLIVFPDEGLPEAPRSPIDGKPMQRAGYARVMDLVAEVEEP